MIGNAREDILRDARNAANPDWITEGVDRQVSALIEYERSATRMVCVAPLFPPGMLQTEGTANTVVAGDAERRGEEVDDNQVRSIVAARMARKEALWRSDRMQLDVFLGMRAIERTLGGLEVAIEQLRYTQKMAALDNVTVRAIPKTDDFNPADMGPFVLYEFPVGQPIVYFEPYGSSNFARPQAVPAQVRAVEVLEEIAMSPDEAHRGCHHTNGETTP